MTTFTCKQCNTSTSVQSEVVMESFGCPSCKALYLQDRGEFRFKYKFKYQPISFMLRVGQTCKIGTESFEITGVLVKHLGDFVYAREYTMQSTAGNYKYLSECEGHWILLKEVDDVDFTKQSRLEMTYNSLLFKKYDYYNSEIVLASGFFDISLENKQCFTVEYIAPPYILSSEDLDGRHVYLGEHIDRKEVKKMFQLTDLPFRNGVGVVQPFPIHIIDTVKIFLVTGILILLCFIFQDTSGEKEVLDTTISINEFNNKEYVSPSFEVKGSAVPIKISLYSDVSNSWAYAGVSVVNEKTNEEEFAEQDIEFYSGYEGGESWVEGSQSEDFYICGLKAGNYHIVVNPTAENVVPTTTVAVDSKTNELPQKAVQILTADGKPVETNLNQVVDSVIKSEQAVTAEQQVSPAESKMLSIKAKIENPSNWNFGISLVLFVVLLIALFIYKHYFETWRWSSSRYSPYQE